MTTSRTYECNFCHRSQSATCEMLGLYWHSQDIELRAFHAVENHICRDCFTALRKINVDTDDSDRKEWSTHVPD